MQTLEKLAHSPMPFTTGGQTINDRITAAKYSLAGSQLGKTVCKATTEELMAPKKKHLDYLLHCTNEPNVSIPTMANLLIERTHNPNLIVVYKTLITIHNLMCYGNERLTQFLASCNTTFNLTTFVDKTNFNAGAIAAGYDMSVHVRRYGKYISEKINTYRQCAFDFCKVKRGREDGLLRTLHTDKLLSTMPILQSLIDALLEFQVTSSELNNGVINCSFILLFRDLVRLFACYNDGVINLLEKFFDMNRKNCRDALTIYKAFLDRLDRVQAFLSIAESVGIDRGEIPDLARAPASLLDTLQAHLYHLEGGRGPQPTSSAAQQMVSQQIYHQQQPFGHPMPQQIDESAKQRYVEEERERLRMYEEQRRHQFPQGDPNPFGSNHQQEQPAVIPYGQQQSDLINFYESPRGPFGPDAGNGPGNQINIDPTNPFASLITSPGRPTGQGQQPGSGPPAYNPDTANPFLSYQQPMSMGPPGQFGAQPPQQQQFGNFNPTGPPTSIAQHQIGDGTGRNGGGSMSNMVGNVPISSSDQRANPMHQPHMPPQLQQYPPQGQQQYGGNYPQQPWNQNFAPNPFGASMPNNYNNPYPPQQQSSDNGLPQGPNPYAQPQHTGQPPSYPGMPPIQHGHPFS